MPSGGGYVSVDTFQAVWHACPLRQADTMRQIKPQGQRNEKSGHRTQKYTSYHSYMRDHDVKRSQHRLDIDRKVTFGATDGSMDPVTGLKWDRGA